MQRKLSLSSSSSAGGGSGALDHAAAAAAATVGAAVAAAGTKRKRAASGSGGRRRGGKASTRARGRSLACNPMQPYQHKNQEQQQPSAGQMVRPKLAPHQQQTRDLYRQGLAQMQLGHPLEAIASLTKAAELGEARLAS